MVYAMDLGCAFSKQLCNDDLNLYSPKDFLHHYSNNPSFEFTAFPTLILSNGGQFFHLTGAVGLKRGHKTCPLSHCSLHTEVCYAAAMASGAGASMASGVGKPHVAVAHPP